MMEEVSTFEIPVNLYRTTSRSISEGGHLHTHRGDNLKSQPFVLLYGRFRIPNPNMNVRERRESVVMEFLA
jgi:hypothetical protein